jgi:hypothetical protein
MWYVVTAIVSVTLTYWFNTRLEPIKLAISYETRRREIMFSKLYDKQLAAYEALSIHVGELIAALARMVSVLKFIPPHRDPEEALMEMDEEHRNAVLEALKGCQHLRRASPGVCRLKPEQQEPHGFGTLTSRAH